MKTIAIATLSLGMQLIAQDGLKQPAQATTIDLVNFAPGGLIRVTTASSNLFVEAWDRPEVEIRTIKSARHAQCLDDIRVAADRRSATELAITTTFPPSNFFTRLFGLTCGAAVEQHVRAPRDSRLVIDHGAGYVMVSRIGGEIEATSRSGDIVVMLPDAGPYAIDAKSKFGSVSSDFAGAAHREKVIGEQFASAIPPQSNPQSHRVYLRIGLGDITIKEVPSTPEAPLAPGECDIPR